MKILNISTFDPKSHKTSILYPYGSYFSLFDWKDSLSAFWEIHPIIDNAFNADKLILNTPLTCKAKGKTHYLLHDSKTEQIIHFACDEKIKCDSSAIFYPIISFTTEPTSSLDDLVTGLSALINIPQASESPPASPIKQEPLFKKISPENSPTLQASTVNTLKILKEIPAPTPAIESHPPQETPLHNNLQPVPDNKNKAETVIEKKDDVKAHEKLPHETHESWLQRLLHFFSSLLCCFHHGIDPETEHQASHSATKGKRL